MGPIPTFSKLTGAFSIAFFSTFFSVVVRLYSKDFFFSFFGPQAIVTANIKKNSKKFFIFEFLSIKIHAKNNKVVIISLYPNDIF
jgi:hypothetical protein